MAQRLFSAGVLIPVLVGLAYWSVWPVALLVAVASTISLFELYTLMRHGSYTPRLATGLVMGLFLCAAATFQGTVSFDLTGFVVSGSILFSLVLELTRRDRRNSLDSWALTFAGAYYIGGLLSYYILLRRLETPLQGGWLAPLAIPPGAAWVYLVLAITWLQDTTAFAVGRAWGRHQMAPYLSPKKTWEGFIGGFVASIITALLATPMMGLPIGYGAAALIGIAGGIAGPLGDLTESFFKRQIGVKDSGHIIPGHGGILDRIDSMIFTAPVIYYLVLLLTVPS
ncbi:MAG: phosphatidate cytidylyltransferase [Chloroflexales bacterium]|nr:phosphatidate cytidylyltransferase [Chloroflexales bacterium]